MTVGSSTSKEPDRTRGSRLKNSLSTIARLYRYFGKYKKTVIFIGVLGIVSSILSIIGPQYLSDMTDSVASSIDKGADVDIQYVTGIAMVLVVVYAVVTVLQYAQSRISWITEEVMGDNLRVQLSQKVSRISVGKLDNMRMGDVVSRFVNDTDTIRLRATDCIVDTLEAIVLLVGTVVMMLVTEWRLGLVAIAPTLAGVVLIRIIARMSQRYYKAQSLNLGKINTLVEETFRGLAVVKAYNGMDEAEEVFRGINKELFSTAFRSRFMSGLMPEITGFINNLSYVLVCVVGSVFILEGTATYGTIVAFIVYLKLMNQPLQNLARSLSSMQEVAAAGERIFEFLDTEELSEESGKTISLDEVRGDVVFESVCFSYVPGREVIHSLDLHVGAGQKIAIVGPTGAGKTTISNLLLRFYEPDSGRILLDGVDISDMPREAVRGQFGVVLQDTWLFSGTVRQNIVFGDDSVPSEKILEACEAVGLSGFIAGLPDGIDTFISDPQQLSNGQKQQMTIARAIVKDAPLLILDEATSSVDTRTEKHIQQAMDHLMQGRTSFIIAHRLSTIMSADRILVIKKGQIIESGTHEELLAMNGFYRNLYDSQFEYCD